MPSLPCCILTKSCRKVYAFQRKQKKNITSLIKKHNVYLYEYVKEL